jgi:hypothetical protein
MFRYQNPLQFAKEKILLTQDSELQLMRHIPLIKACSLIPGPQTR